jgi:hypothetical protein
MKRIFAYAILTATALVLSGCGTDTPKGFVCPSVSGLVDASTLAQLRPGTTDDSGLIYKVDVTKVGLTCEFEPATSTVTARIGMDFTATRPPGGDSAQYTVPYFIALSTDGTTIVDKKLYNVQFAFAPGQASATFSDRIDPYTIVVSPERKATDYAVLLGLQLTKDQLDYNRRSRFPK